VGVDDSFGFDGAIKGIDRPFDTLCESMDEGNQHETFVSSLTAHRDIPARWTEVAYLQKRTKGIWSG